MNQLAATTDLAKKLSERPKLIRSHVVTAGMAICEAAERATAQNAGELGAATRHATRGACIWAMDNLWYDVMSAHARESFGFSKDKFYKECGWPD